MLALFLGSEASGGATAFFMIKHCIKKNNKIINQGTKMNLTKIKGYC